MVLCYKNSVVSRIHKFPIFIKQKKIFGKMSPHPSYKVANQKKAQSTHLTQLLPRRFEDAEEGRSRQKTRKLKKIEYLEEICHFKLMLTLLLGVAIKYIGEYFFSGVAFNQASLL